MFIERILPEVVGAKSSLAERLQAYAAEAGASIAPVERSLAHTSAPLQNAGAFLDRFTNCWRYEYGLPYELKDTMLWGTSMWIEVAHLFHALTAAGNRLPDAQLREYASRLSDEPKHPAVLVEMIPAHRTAASVNMQFEVLGLGDGNRTVDWVLSAPDGRAVVLDVKSRSADFLAQAEQMSSDGTLPPPDHDPALLFRSVATKLRKANPAESLQGAWITTHIKQDDKRLRDSFSAIDPDRVHFAVLSDWEPDVCLLVRREEHRRLLLELFRATESSRFTYVAERRLAL